MVRDKNCLGMPCFNPIHLDVGRLEKIPLMKGWRNSPRKNIMRVCKTMFENGWQCPEGHKFDQELYDENVEKGWEVHQW